MSILSCFGGGRMGLTLSNSPVLTVASILVAGGGGELCAQDISFPNERLVPSPSNTAGPGPS